MPFNTQLPLIHHLVIKLTISYVRYEDCETSHPITAHRCHRLSASRFLFLIIHLRQWNNSRLPFVTSYLLSPERKKLKENDDALTLNGWMKITHNNLLNLSRLEFIFSLTRFPKLQVTHAAINIENKKLLCMIRGKF